MSGPFSTYSDEELRKLYLSFDADTREKLGMLGLRCSIRMFEQLVSAVKKHGKQVAE